MWRLTDEQRELREHVRRFVLAEVRPRMLKVDETCDYPFEVHNALATARLDRAGDPRGVRRPRCHERRLRRLYRRTGKDLRNRVADGRVREAHGTAIMLAGSEDQKRRFLPSLASGEQLGSYALTEPDVGSDPAALQTRAERHGDRYVFNGQKRFIGNAGL